jgi:hypothetical protein
MIHEYDYNNSGYYTLYLKHVSETGLWSRIQVEPSQLGPTDRLSGDRCLLHLLDVPPNDRDRIQPPERRTLDNIPNCDSYINTPY